MKKASMGLPLGYGFIEVIGIILALILVAIAAYFIFFRIFSHS